MRIDVLILVRNNVSRDARVLKEARSLAGEGWTVRCMGIVTGPGDYEFEETDFGAILRVRTVSSRGAAAATGAAGSVGATRTPHSPIRRGVLSDARHFLGRIRENVLLARAARLLRPRLVIACDLTTLLAGVLLKRRGAHLVYDAHELYPEIDPSRTSTWKRLYSLLERVLIQRADRVMTVSSALAEELSRRYGVRDIAVVMNGPAACLGKAGPVHDPVRILYQGGFGPNRGLETLVGGMKRLRGVATLSLQGFGGLRDTLESIVRENGLDDVVSFVEPCAPEETVRAASGYDVGVANYLPTHLNNRIATPTKMFDYMAAGLALLVARVPSTEAIVEGSGAGEVFDPADSEDMFEALARLASDPDALAAAKSTSASMCARYAWDEQARELLAEVRRALGPGREAPSGGEHA